MKKTNDQPTTKDPKQAFSETLQTAVWDAEWKLNNTEESLKGHLESLREECDRLLGQLERDEHLSDRLNYADELDRLLAQRAKQVEAKKWMKALADKARDAGMNLEMLDRCSDKS